MRRRKSEWTEMSKISFRASGSFFSLGMFLCVLVMTPQIYGQSQKNKCLSTVSLSRREECKVAERLKLYVEYHRSQRWDLVESILCDEKLSFGYGQIVKLSMEEKQAIVENIKRIHILSFSQPIAHGSTSDYSRPMSKQGFVICGLLEFKKEDGEIIKSKAFVKPYYRKGKWVFSQFYITYFTKSTSYCGS
jgi:hypothetical protein